MGPWRVAPVHAVAGVGDWVIRPRRPRLVQGLRQLENLPRELQQLLICVSSSWTVDHCWFASTSRFASARFWLIITKVERKIASRETIIVSRPYGYDSMPRPIQSEIQATWR
jgi:hypothetical protein